MKMVENVLRDFLGYWVVVRFEVKLKLEVED